MAEQVAGRILRILDSLAINCSAGLSEEEEQEAHKQIELCKNLLAGMIHAVPSGATTAAKAQAETVDRFHVEFGDWVNITGQSRLAAEQRRRALVSLRSCATLLIVQAKGADQVLAQIHARSSAPPLSEL